MLHETKLNFGKLPTRLQELSIDCRQNDKKIGLHIAEMPPSVRVLSISGSKSLKESELLKIPSTVKTLYFKLPVEWTTDYSRLRDKYDIR